MVKRGIIAGMRYAPAMLTVFLSGCAGAPYWVHDVEDFHPIPMVFSVSQGVLEKSCPRQWPESVVRGCTLRYRNPDTCVVLLGPEANDCTREHEVEGHCAGWSHDGRMAFTQTCGPGK